MIDCESGIYCIENISNGKKYIGRDIQVKSKRRYYNHLTKLRKNNHTNIHLQNSWNKYGESNFKFSILEFCTPDKLNEREIYYINRSMSNFFEYGYNKNAGGGGNHGWVPSDETRKRISESHKGERNPNYGKKLNEKQRKALLKSGKEHPRYGTHLSKKQKENLRNKMLMEKSPVFGTLKKNRKSSFYGVSIYNQTSKRKDKEYKKRYWKAQIRVDRIQNVIGYFKTEIDAAKEYDKYIIIRKLKNPLNFPRFFYFFNIGFIFELYNFLVGRSNIRL